jgi:hypothetical protein
VAALLGSVTQAVLAFLIHIDDCSSAWDGRKAPANAAGSLRPALAVEGIPSGFSKPIRCLTEQMDKLISAIYIMETVAKLVSRPYGNQWFSQFMSWK